LVSTASCVDACADFFGGRFAAGEPFEAGDGRAKVFGCKVRKRRSAQRLQRSKRQLLKNALTAHRRRIEEDLRAELIDRVLTMSRAFFEKVVVDLLLAMGYGGGAPTPANVSAEQVTGASTESLTKMRSASTSSMSRQSGMHPATWSASTRSENSLARWMSEAP
jgi:hypothetical protein